MLKMFWFWISFQSFWNCMHKHMNGKKILESSVRWCWAFLFLFFWFLFFLLHPTLKQITNFHIISTFGRSVFFTIIMIFYFDHFSILHSVDLKFHLHYTTNSFPLRCGFMNRNFIFISHCFPFRWMVLYCLVWCGVCVCFFYRRCWFCVA